MIRKMLTSAMFAGLVAGFAAAMLHFAFVERYILLGEDYESGASTHFAAVAPESHSDAQADAARADQAHGTQRAKDGGTTGPEHHHGAVDRSGSLARDGLTVAFSVMVYIGYALLLVAGFALADRLGHRVTAPIGVLWGIAGFAAFQLVPAMGLAPELPGTVAADLSARQTWWLGTAVSTALALGLIGYGKGWMAYSLAAGLLALPHVIGAPQVEGFSGLAPPEIAAAFAARALGVGLAAWLLLGWLSARIWDDQAT